MKLFAAALAAVGTLAAAPVARAEAPVAKKELKVGFVPGPYIDEFRVGVEPWLTKRGYTVKYYNFSAGLEANNAVFKDEIDANVMQHTVYLNAYNDRNKTDLAGIVHVPTPPMGLYSRAYKAAADVKAGATVAVPSDPVNLERALKILRDLGWIELKSNGNPVDVTELDVIKNPRGVKIVPLEAAQAPRALDDVELAAVQGNFAIFSGLKLSEALALEKMTTPYINVVAIRKGNVDTAWARDIAAAYKSDDFKAAIRADRFYDGFRLPDYFD
ncbi:methionine-binding protein [Chelatococcus reniformis]|uniref:Methionine-binding protein n=2 Tax=Chelatococcus reniformis TaxID=1494448 RepID=A0A916XDA8_9HYPH|nr:MetQ/NlpA family ABC transporter substrate-binding protein [Chelatococcus reniformis]GGC65489.1 methionine-binding protein [Chelatococcus reniformis]